MVSNPLISKERRSWSGECTGADTMDQADTAERGLDLARPDECKEQEVGVALLQALEQYQEGANRRRGGDPSARG
jgi:hypothetical protein